MFNPVAMPGPNHAATYEIWINPPASLPASIPNHFLFGCQQTTALGGMALWMNTDRRLYMDLTAAPGSSLLLTQPLTAPLAAGQWYHLALTWDFANTIDGTRTFMAFTNGAVSFQSTVTKSTIYPLGINPTADNFALHGSAYDHRWVSGFVGAMDEFKVWDCVITNFSNRFRDESGNTNSMSVANVAAGSVGSTSAQLQGQLLDTGGHENPAIRIYWGATDGQTNPLAWAHCETLGTRSLGVFDATVTGLTPGLKYYFRCNASSSASSAWAVNSAEFTTLPVFTILASSGSGGTITPSGAVNVQGGQNVNFLVQSEADAYVAEVKVDGQPIGVFGPGTTTVHHAFAGIATNHTIAAAFNHPPTIGLRVSATNGIAPLRVLFDFTASTDADGNIVRAEVDRSGDDTYDASCEGAGQVLVEFGAPGRFTSQARIIDAYGITSQDTVTIEVFGAAPDASLSVQPTNPVAGTMVLLVGTNSTAAIGHQIAIYEWDIDGNGAYEIISQTGSVSCAYGTTGQYPVVLRVTDDQGLQDSASTLITVTPATLPPTVVLSANPDYGEVPAFIRFIAAASDDGYATQFRWDFNGDGTIDMLSTTSSVSHVYTQVGNFQAKVTVVDDSGLSASATVSIAIKQGSQMKVWISEPKDSGASDGVPHIWGAAVTLVAHAARSASDAESLQFKYRLAGAPTWVNIGMPLYPAPHAFKSTWDVTALTPGACYELIAVATDYDSSMVTSEIVTVIVDPDENKTPGHGNEHLVDGKHTKEATFGRDKTADMQLYDGTRVQVPPETIDDNPTVSIELTGQNTNQVNGSAKGMSSINANRKVSLDGKPDLGKPITILVPYPDSDEDGVVDGTTVPETTLTVHWFDNYEGKWKKVLAQTVDTKANCAKFTTYHLTEFGLFGSVNLLEPAHGGILMSHPQAYTNTTLAGNVTDGNKVSFWRSKTAPDAPQVFVYAFTNYCGAILDEAILSNYGEAGLGKALYSRDFSVQTSMDGTDFKSVAGGTLTAQEEPQTFAIGSVTCRVVKLVISNGVDETAWELSEFALHGKLTPDPDADGMPDEWEAKYFGEFGRDGNGDWDADGIKDKPEYDMGTDPTRKDSDGDGVNDWHEWMAGTSSTDGHSFFKAGQDMSPAEGMIVRWHTMTGRIYRVLGTTNMVVGAWSNLSPVITGNGAEHAFTNKDPSANAKFYRVSVGLQP
jgi:PKD repeat protein